MQISRHNILFEQETNHQSQWTWSRIRSNILNITHASACTYKHLFYYTHTHAYFMYTKLLMYKSIIKWSILFFFITEFHWKNKNYNFTLVMLFLFKNLKFRRKKRFLDVDGIQIYDLSKTFNQNLNYAKLRSFFFFLKNFVYIQFA